MFLTCGKWTFFALEKRYTLIITMKSRYFLMPLFAFFIALFSAFASFDDPLTSLLAKLASYASKTPFEKVYLHLDKPYYAAGDDIWLKAYLVNTNTDSPSGLSEILYVDLINEQGKTKKNLKLPVQGGITWGNISLPDTLAEGNYRIRAYTQYMRNFGDEFFFDKTIKIGNSLNNRIFAKANHVFSSASGKNQLTTTITFKNDKEQPYADADLKYSIMLNGAEEFKGKSKTNANGEAVLVASDLKPQVFSQGIIKTEITTASKTNLTKEIPIKATSNNADVQFLPEGGHLVAGLPCKIGVKAINSLGKGENVKGWIINSEGNEILNFETTHLGMGNFIFAPLANQTFKAKLQFADGSTKEFALPVAEQSGYALMVNNADTAKISVRIAMTADLIGKDALTLVCTKNGQVYFNQSLKAEKQVTLISLLKKELSSGLYQFNLFNTQGISIAERIAFVNNADDKIALQVSGLATSYARKSTITANMVAQNNGQPTQGSFSVAVTNASAVKPDEENETNILSSLLLTSDLKGYIENPNYYFMGGKNALSDLDNLLLTQGWRKTDWTKVANNTLPTLNFKPEKTLSISGRIIKGKKPVPQGKVSLVSTQGGFFYKDTVADNEGRFEFDNLIFPDTTKFIIQARTAKDRKFVTIDIDQTQPVMVTPNKNLSDVEVNVNNMLNDYLQQSKRYFNDQINKGFLNKTIMLDEIKVVEKKNPASNSQNLNGAGRADAIFTADDFNTGLPLSSILQGRVAGVIVRNQQAYSMRNLANSAPMAIVVDGLNMGADYNLDDYNSFDIESVEVLKPGPMTAIYGSQGTQGIILITSKRGGSVAYNRYAPGIITYSPGGYATIKEFYSPKYASLESLTNDYRTTVYWQPQLVTDAEGKANFTYYNTDVPGTYRMVIEGIDLQGNIARKVLTYQVK